MTEREGEGVDTAQRFGYTRSARFQDEVREWGTGEVGIEWGFFAVQDRFGCRWMYSETDGKMGYLSRY